MCLPSLLLCSQSHKPTFRSWFNQMQIRNGPLKYLKVYDCTSLHPFALTKNPFSVNSAIRNKEIGASLPCYPVPHRFVSGASEFAWSRDKGIKVFQLSPRWGWGTALLEQAVWRERLQFLGTGNGWTPMVELCCCIIGQNTGGMASSVDSTPITGCWDGWL